MNLNTIKPISYVKANAAEILDNLATTGQSLGITQHGEIKAVLVSAKEYNRTQETLAFFKLLALGDEDIRAGRVKPISDFTSTMRKKLAAQEQ